MALGQPLMNPEQEGSSTKDKTALLKEKPPKPTGAKPKDQIRIQGSESESDTVPDLGNDYDDPGYFEDNYDKADSEEEASYDPVIKTDSEEEATYDTYSKTFIEEDPYESMYGGEDTMPRALPPHKVKSRSQPEAHMSYFLGDIDRKEAEQKLRVQAKPGSFLVRKNGKIFKLSWLSFQGQMWHANMYQVRGKIFLSKKNQFSTISEMVRHYQDSNKHSPNSPFPLGTPLENPEIKFSRLRGNDDLEDLDLENYFGIDEAEDGEEREEDTEEDETEQNNRSSAGHLAYNFGDIGRREAEQKVKDKGTPGSFLLRENDNMFKLTWMTFQGKVLHARLLEAKGKYYISKQKKFSSIPRMVKHYQAYPRSSENALGVPMHTF